MRKVLVLLMMLAAGATGFAQQRADYRVVPLPMSIQADTTKVFTLQQGMGIAFCLDHLAKDVSGLLNSFTFIVLLFISPFMPVNICFMYIGGTCIG